MSVHTGQRVLTLSTPKQLKAIGHPVRARILQALEDRPASAQELSRRLQESHGKIGYHVKVLLAAGFVQVVEERPVRAVVERILAPTYDRITYASTDQDDRLGFLLRQTAREFVPGDPQPFEDEYRLMTATMSPDRAAEFAAELSMLIERFADSDTDSGNPTTFGMVGAVFRTAVQPERP